MNTECHHEHTKQALGDAQRDTVLVVTGFGLFRNHHSNPSWEAIKSHEFHINRPGVKVIKKCVQVRYDEVDSAVEQLWTEHKPDLVVHVGLASFETHIRVEQLARHGPFIHGDVSNSAPHEHLRTFDEAPPTGAMAGVEDNVMRREYSCKPCHFDSSSTGLNVDLLCEQLHTLHRDGHISIGAKKSTDAGLYVCEYIYQKSLRVCNRSVFLHVPDVSDKCSLRDISVALSRAIELLVDQIKTATLT